MGQTPRDDVHQIGLSCGSHLNSSQGAIYKCLSLNVTQATNLRDVFNTFFQFLNNYLNCELKDYITRLSFEL